MLSSNLKITLLCAANCCAALLVVAIGLVIWSKFHLLLRTLGPDNVIFGLLFLLLAIPAFLVIALLGRRALPRASNIIHLFVIPGGLYAVLIAAISKLPALYPFHGDSGVIALFTALFVCAVGILVNVLVPHSALQKVIGH
jgi:hypothetical protein